MPLPAAYSSFGSAPILQPVIRVFPLDLAAIVERRKFCFHKCLKCARVSCIVVDEYVLMKFVFQRKSYPDAAFLITTRTVAPPKPRSETTAR